MSFGINKGGSETSNSSTDELIKQIFGQSTTSSSTGSSTSAGTSTQAQSGTSEGQSSRVLTPEQQAVSPTIANVILSLSKNPEQFFAPSQAAARNEVNDNYAGVEGTLRDQFLTGGGGGRSGRYGRAVMDTELARRGALSDVDTAYRIEGAKAPLTAAQLAQQFLGINFGEKTSSTNSGVATGTNQTTANTNDLSSVISSGTSTTDRQVDQEGKTKKGMGFNLGI